MRIKCPTTNGLCSPRILDLWINPVVVAHLIKFSYFVNVSISDCDPSWLAQIRKISSHSNLVVKMSLKILSGRKRGNAVYSHFKYESVTNKSSFIISGVGVNERKLCGRLIAGKNTTNLLNHLKYLLPSTYIQRGMLCCSADLIHWSRPLITPCSREW